MAHATIFQKLCSFENIHAAFRKAAKGKRKKDAVLHFSFYAEQYLLKYAIPVLNRLPKSQKFTLGDRIQHLLSEILEKSIEASYADNTCKMELLPQVNLLLEKLRFFCRLGHELSYLSMIQYKELILRADEIGRMTGGWLKSLSHNNKG